MRLNIGGGGLRSLLLCLVLLLTAFSSATAHEAWSVDVAQMLMADQWDMEAGEQPAVVGYVIHLVEVERSLAHSLGFQMELETKESPGLWLVAGRDLDLSFQLEGPLTWSAQSQIHLDGDHQAKSYDSWLVTMDGEPLHVDVSKMKVPPDPHQSKEERLEITIFAKTIQDERIESEIHISYETLQGSAAEVSTTHWVSAATDQPLAVVARQVNTGRRTEYQYFAVYVAGSLIPAELIPDDAPVWPMGSVKGIEQFMAGVPQQRWAEVGVSLTTAKRIGDGSWMALFRWETSTGCTGKWEQCQTQHIFSVPRVRSTPNCTLSLKRLPAKVNNRFCALAFEMTYISVKTCCCRLHCCPSLSALRVGSRPWCLTGG